MSLTLTPDAAVQQLQDLHAKRRGEPAQDLRPLLGVDDQKIARHTPFHPSGRETQLGLYQILGYVHKFDGARATGLSRTLLLTSASCMNRLT